MNPDQILAEPLGTLYAALAVGAMLTPLVVLSVTQLVSLWDFARERYAPAPTIAAAFRLGVCIALWVPAAKILTGYDWRDSEIVQGFGALVLIACITWMVLRAALELVRWCDERDFPGRMVENVARHWELIRRRMRERRQLRYALSESREETSLPARVLDEGEDPRRRNSRGWRGTDDGDQGGRPWT